MELCTEMKLVGDTYGSGFGCGLTLTGSATIKGFEKVGEDPPSLRYENGKGLALTVHKRQEQDALDVVQESILKAYKSLKTLREPEYFRTWLTKIVINTAQDTLRARQRTAPLEEELDLPAPEGLPPEERMDLHGAIARLPEKYQDVIKLKYFDGYTIREISEATGMPQGTVSVYLRRAVKELQTLLKEEPVCKKK